MIQLTCAFRLLFIALACFPLNPVAAVAEDLTFELPPVIFDAEASFESLGRETFVPKEKIVTPPARQSVVKRLGDEQAFPLVNLGFPAGTSGAKLGGRSVEDVQVSTLGVPLNLPQGGGGDLSIFPAFLWSEVELSRTPITAGYAPSAASGAVNLKLWSREKILRHPRAEERDSRLTFSADRQVQTFSIATRKHRSAINVGMNLGMQTGPAASLSYEFYRDATSLYRFHLLGTDQKGDSPGSKTLPTPLAQLIQWRVIPVLETQREIGGTSTASGGRRGGFILESTLFGDLSGLRRDNPASAAFNTASKTQQVGMEHALIKDDTTLSLSARYTRFALDANSGASAVDHVEWPYLVGVTQRLELGPRSELKLTLQGSGVTGVGLSPGARASARVLDEDRSRGEKFFELHLTPKQPTIQARYYQIPFFYAGNPELRTERVYSAIAGIERRWTEFRLRSMLKGEFREQVQIDREDPVQSALQGATVYSTVNAGTARLLYLDQQAEWSPTRRLDLKANVLLTLSRMQDLQTPYPDLPAFSARGRAVYHLSETLDLEARAQYLGPSVSAVHPSVSPTGGRFHPNSALYDLEARASLSRDLQLQVGVENLTHEFAEVVLDYPLPGRIFYFGAQLAL